ncbi:MAG: oligoendopeptidase F [Christensenellaceae bacterium]|nr:oligoendopeptidase F [Christensenellaceae bacterium]
MKIPERKNVKEKYKWNLNDLVDGDEAWEKKYGEIASTISSFADYKGKLGDDEVLLEYLKKCDETMVELLKVYCYAYMKTHEDMRVKKYQEMFARVGATGVMLSTVTAFAEPEICERSEEELIALSKKPEFSDYSYRFERLAKDKKHVLSEKEEKILAETGNFTDNFNDAFQMFDSADVKFRPVDVDGKEIEMSHGTYGVLLQNPCQEVRRKAFESMFDAYKEHINTIAAIYAGSVKKDWFYSKVRGYKSSLEGALSHTDVDVRAYDNLIKAVDNNCRYMHRYMALRKKLLNVETLNMWDLHVPMIKGADISVSYEKAFEMVKKALKPLGEEYAALLDRAYNEKWIDVVENKGKKSGAYSLGTYGCHPFVLLNYQKTTHDVFTIAHELGHAMHSYYSCEAQPFAKSDYEIFVAEIASTVNEVLMLKYLLAETKDADTKKFLLSYYLDMFRTTLFRQTMFAEFELKAHTLAEENKPLTAEGLSDIYYDLNKKYYGKAVKHNELIRYEWARIPHFYRQYYVYQYATGITAAVSIANNILKNGDKAFYGYKKFLSAGGSMPPVEILKLAGVDLTTEQPFNVAMREFRDTLNTLEKLYDEK